MATTYWSNQPDQVPLYSDWKVLFTTYGAPTQDYKDAGSVSTSSLSSSDGESVVVDPANNKQNNENIVSSSPSKEEEQQKEVAFAVHRNMIGPRSKYFTNSFTSTTASDGTSSVINLPSNLSPKAFDSMAKAFEVLLDYCYNIHNAATEDVFADTNSKLTTENAVAMYCLCNYFQMDDEVCIKVREFITNDLNEDTVATYYQHVKYFRNGCSADNNDDDDDEKEEDKEDTASKTSTALLNVAPIHDLVAYLCYKFPRVLAPAATQDDDTNTTDDDDHDDDASHNELAKIADLALWLSIGSLLSAGNTIDESNNENKKAIDDDSKVWSENITSFFDHGKPNDLQKTFRILTNETVLPVISEKVALRLLEHERLHGLSDDDVAHHPSSDDDHQSITSDVSKSTDSTDDDHEHARVIEVSRGGSSSSESGSLLSRKTTSLQQRCIKSLAASNWLGEENDIENLRGTGKLSAMTSTYVLEELLIESVTGERKLGTKMRVLQEEVEIEKQLRLDEQGMNHLQITKLKVDLVKEQSKQQRLTEVLEEEASKRDAAERKNVTFDARLDEEKKKLQKEIHALENKLDVETKRSFSLDLRYRALESARGRTETDRELLELTCKETITRLDAMSSQEEWWNNACGVMTPLILMLSTMNDRRECEKIKGMLQQVVRDPSSYERNFLHKNIDEDGEDVTVDLTNNNTLQSKIERDMMNLDLDMDGSCSLCTRETLRDDGIDIDGHLEGLNAL